MRKLTNELAEAPTDEEREYYFLEGEEDKFARIGCSVGSCSVRAIASVQTTRSRIATFYAENPGECIRTEEERASLESDLPIPYLQSLATPSETSKPVLGSPKKAKYSGVRALISKLLT
ncbi:MAG: hypothetical protein JWN82_203 [Candidatus Saccharibacteria bacterium]|nr:hypothetical protein [Candidatus Saccharibacteria bacterium]